MKKREENDDMSVDKRDECR